MLIKSYLSYDSRLKGPLRPGRLLDNIAVKELLSEQLETILGLLAWLDYTATGRTKSRFKAVLSCAASITTAVSVFILVVPFTSMSFILDCVRSGESWSAACVRYAMRLGLPT